MTCGFSYSCWSRPSTASVVYVQRQWLQLPTQGCWSSCRGFGRWRNGQRHWPATQVFLERVEEKKILRWLLHLKWRPSWQLLLKITLKGRFGPWTFNWSFDPYVTVTSGDSRFRLDVPLFFCTSFSKNAKRFRGQGWCMCVKEMRKFQRHWRQTRKTPGFFNPISALRLTFTPKP